MTGSSRLTSRTSNRSSAPVSGAQRLCRPCQPGQSGRLSIRHSPEHRGAERGGERQRDQQRHLVLADVAAEDLAARADAVGDRVRVHADPLGGGDAAAVLLEVEHQRRAQAVALVVVGGERRRGARARSAASAPDRRRTAPRARRRGTRSRCPAGAGSAIATLAVSAASRWVRRKPASPRPGAPRAIETPSALGRGGQRVDQLARDLAVAPEPRPHRAAVDRQHQRPARLQVRATAAAAARSSRGSTCGSSGVGRRPQHEPEVVPAQVVAEDRARRRRCRPPSRPRIARDRLAPQRLRAADPALALALVLGAQPLHERVVELEVDLDRAASWRPAAARPGGGEPSRSSHACSSTPSASRWMRSSTSSGTPRRASARAYAYASAGDSTSSGATPRRNARAHDSSPARPRSRMSSRVSGSAEISGTSRMSRSAMSPAMSSASRSTACAAAKQHVPDGLLAGRVNPCRGHARKATSGLVADHREHGAGLDLRALARRAARRAARAAGATISCSIFIASTISSGSPASTMAPCLDHHAHHAAGERRLRASPAARRATPRGSAAPRPGRADPRRC